MRVELDIFSGRPNPRWELDGHDRQDLLRLQDRLAAAASVAPMPPALGYRGFHYGDGAERCHAYRGHVRTRGAALADPDFSIEHFLLARLPPEFAGLRERVLSELEPPPQSCSRPPDPI